MWIISDAGEWVWKWVVAGPGELIWRMSAWNNRRMLRHPWWWP